MFITFPTSRLGCHNIYLIQPSPFAPTGSPRNMPPTKHVTVQNKSVGIIGMGDMGKMYACKIAAAGWRSVCFDQSLPSLADC